MEVSQELISRSINGLLIFTTVGVSGEYLGRKWGEREAKQLLNAELSPDSPLRVAMKE
jgi:hypothetical protein